MIETLDLVMEGYILPVRMIKKEELIECEKIQSIAFAYSLDTKKSENKDSEDPNQDSSHIGFFNDENVMTACMEMPEYKVNYDGNIVKMVGIGGVASLPEYRFGGAVRQTIEVAIRQMADNGAVFSSLYPFSHSYYRKFGYETCQMSKEFQFPIEAISNFRYTGEARMLKSGDSTDELNAIFESYFGQYNLSIKRNKREWEKILSDDPYKDRVYTYLLKNDDGNSAYIVIEAKDAKDSDDKIAMIREVAFTNPQGIKDVLGFIYRLSAQYTKIHMYLPDNIPLHSIMDESYNLDISYSNQQMTRVINVEKALELKRYFNDTEYTIKVSDSLIDSNNGVFSVSSKNGKTEVKQLSDNSIADLELDIRTLAPLLLGFLTIEEAMYKDDIKVNSNLETLKRNFIRRHVYLTDHF